MEYLQKFGIQIGFLFSGLFGAILMTTKSDKTDIKSVVLSLIGGMAAFLLNLLAVEAIS